jgi:hypothetical protein
MKIGGQNNMTQWTITVEEDPKTKELILPFTEEILEAVGWKEGDVIVWKKKDDKSWTLRKKVDKMAEKSV